jgi:hypothetical protein
MFLEALGTTLKLWMVQFSAPVWFLGSTHLPSSAPSEALKKKTVLFTAGSLS